jgi:8-oxo-dGTP pyrophosphatase MutT (NUDIX family)
VERNKIKNKLRKMLKDRPETKYAGVLIKSLDTNKVLLILRSEICSNPFKWALCSGGINESEDTLEGLKREVTEELSIDPNIIDFKYITTEDEEGFVFPYYQGYVKSEFTPTLNEENLLSKKENEQLA